MIRNPLRLFLFATILLLTSYNINPHTFAANQESGDEHWAGDLTVPGFDSYVTALVSDMQGNTYAGGGFTAIGGEIVNHIGKWDGSTWSGLGNGLDEQVNTLAVDSQGNLYTDVLIIPDSGLSETEIMRWDGSAWSALEGDLTSLVDTLKEGRESNILITDLVVDSRGQLYAGGFFYLINTEQYVGFVAGWDGSSWSLLGSGMNHTVYNLAVDGQGNLYAGGEFTLAGGIPANRIAKWDGKSWNALGSGLGGEAPSIADLEADDSGNLFVTGQFENAGGIPVQLIAMWDGSSWKDLAPGINRGWLEGDSPLIYDLTISQRGDLYAGGSFVAIDGVEANNIARWDGAAWRALGTTTGNGVNERVLAVSVDENDQVFVGGFFTNAGGLPANHIAWWDGSTWFTWIEGSEGGMNNMVDALAVDHDGNLYAGGYFTSAGEIPANHIARWDGLEWSTLANGVNASVHALVLNSSGALYAGGDFTAAGDVAVNYIARWDGATWSTLDAGMAAEHTASPQVRALAVDSQGNLYAGGDFTSAGGIAANYIARWDGSAWSPLGRGMDDQVTELVVDPQGILYAAGWFKKAGDVEANGIARWDGSSWSALGSGTNMIEAIAIDQDNNLYAAGMIYPPSDNSTFHYIARWDGSTWSPLGGGVDNFIHTLAVDQQSNLYAMGDFTNASETPARRIARWDGTNWSPLGSGIGGAESDYSTLGTLVVDDWGNLYVGGQFTLAGNKPSANLAKWCAKLEAGGCRFSFEARAHTPESTPVLSAPVPLSSIIPTIIATEPGLIPTLTPTDNSTGVTNEASMDVRYWIGAGIILTLLLGGLLLFLSRRT